MKTARPSRALLKRIRERTARQGDCLVWLDRHGQPYSARDHRGGPQLRWKEQVLYVRQVWHLHTTRQPVPDGSILQYACDTPGCICHTEVVSHAEHARRVAASGALQGLERRRKIAEAKRAANATLQPWQVQLVRFGPQSAAHYADEFGISRGLAARVRRGDAWQDYEAGPFNGLGGRATQHCQLAANASRYVKTRVQAA